MLCRIADSESDALGNFTPKVADFDLSKLHGDELLNANSSVLVGTPIYMAPEQLNSRKYGGPHSAKASFAADIYSLGAILFELLAGQPPVTGRSFHEALDNIRNARKLNLAKVRPDLTKTLARSSQPA